MDALIALIVDEGNWLPASMMLAFVSTLILLYRNDGTSISARRRVTAVLNIFFGVTIGTMVFGHILAVTTRHLLGTLEGSMLKLYAIGILLAVPSWSLIHHARGLFAPGNDDGRKTTLLNAWLAITLIALGIHNLPLAAPAFLNIGYQLHKRRVAGWAFLSMAVLINAGLFIGSLLFMTSGQSFEEFIEMK